MYFTFVDSSWPWYVGKYQSLCSTVIFKQNSSTTHNLPDFCYTPSRTWKPGTNAS